MASPLQISDRRERALVGAADAVLRIAAPAVRRRQVRRSAAARTRPRRVLLLRLERIGDLLMSLDAIGDISAAIPDGEIDLVVGSWNAELARAIPGLARVETLDPAWLARERSGLGMPRLLARAHGWRRRRYDLALNFEPDIRSNLLLATSGAAVTAGFLSGGGGPLLDVALDYDPRARTIENTRRLAAAALGVPPRSVPARLQFPPDVRRRAVHALAGARPPIVGVHASGGRAIKQWDPAQFGMVASRLVREQGGTIVLTGSAGDRPMVDAVRRALPAESVIDLAAGLDLPALAAVIERFDVYITGDTGPMHLAAAVGTPVVAVFGPSDPARYAPIGTAHRIVRIDLPCAPCNRIRQPPARCVGHTPDCLRGISADAVYRAAVDALAGHVARGARTGSA